MSGSSSAIWSGGTIGRVTRKNLHQTHAAPIATNAVKLVSKSVASQDAGSRVECRRTAFVVAVSAELLGESDEKSFRPADVAEPIRVSVLDNFAHELRAALAKSAERLVDVVHGEHDAQVA